MKTGALLKRWAMTGLVMVLTIILFAIPAFAAEEAAADAEKDFTKQLVGIIIAAAVVVAAVVLGIVFREKLKKFFRVYKSESKKIVWLPWDQTRKSTLVVLVVLVVCALAICLLDFGLSKGYLAFINLF